MQCVMPGPISSQHRGCQTWSLTQRRALLSSRQSLPQQSSPQHRCSLRQRPCQQAPNSRQHHFLPAAASSTAEQPEQRHGTEALRQALQQLWSPLACTLHWLKALAKSSEYRLAMRNVRLIMMAAPLVRSQSNTLLLLTKAMAKFVDWYVLLLFLRVLLSWFPTFKWEGQPWLAVRQLTDPYLNIFRNIIPPLMGVMDFTPLLGFVILQNLQGWLQKVSKAPGEFDW